MTCIFCALCIDNLHFCGKPRLSAEISKGNPRCDVILEYYGMAMQGGSPAYYNNKSSKLKVVD